MSPGAMSLPERILAAAQGPAYVHGLPIQVKMRDAACSRGTKVVTFQPRCKGDDCALFKDPRMRASCPRGFGAVYDGERDEVVGTFAGPIKFDGVTEEDDDDADDTSLPTGLIHRWHRDGELEVIREDKENGKFALVKFMEHRGEWLAVFGSKNGHRLAGRDGARERAHDRDEPAVIRQVAAEVHRHWDALLGFFREHPEVTLVGELCDGLHFVPIDTPEPVVKFFGCFTGLGRAVDPAVAFRWLADHRIASVAWSVMDTSSPRWFEACIASARCGTGEGSVLYFRNRRTGEVYLAKNKTAAYILKRVARELLKPSFNDRGRRGFHSLFACLEDRVVDRSRYHMLCTAKAVEFAEYLYAFADWMMRSRIPAEALDFKPVASEVIGELGQVGFGNVWARFLRETGRDEIEVGTGDIGPFDEERFRAGAARARGPGRPADGPEPVVAFFQGPQGAGKSTAGDDAARLLRGFGLRVEIVEQDQWYGRSASCQAYMQYLLEHTDADVVLVTRCNANPRHYSAYLRRALAAGGRAVFLAPEGIETPEGLLVCLEGVRTRSASGDGLLIGRIEKDPEEAERIVRATHADLRVHDKAVRFAREDRAATARAIADILTAVREDPAHPAIVHRDGTSPPSLVALRLSRDGDAALRRAALEHGVACQPSMHLTQVFCDNRKGGVAGFEAAPDGQRGSFTATHLVVRNSDGQAAFRVRAGFPVHSGRPHVTARVGTGSAARQSLQFVQCDDPAVVTVHELGELVVDGRFAWS